VSAASEPPPSEKIPGTSGGGAPYVIGILVLGVLAGGLVCWKSKQASPTTTSQSASALQVASTPPQPQLPQFAPPPPPKLDEEIDAGAAPSAKATGQSAAPAGAGPCGKCTDGQTSPALNTALRSRVQSTQSCYNRALQHNSEVAGSMTVSVQVGSTGAVCGASIVNDTVHSTEVSSCVLGRIRGQSFPPPTSGCVTLNIPIAFATKQ
jgi:hypothetical protein